jgi:VIT1/CCC1 family predicted Fe2+/Mn2+ transporter
MGNHGTPSRRVLEPSERIAEVLFGLIMVLTFTGSLSIAEAGRDDVRAMLIGALGCNLAWGVIDGVLYLMGSLADRERNLATYLAIRNARDADEAGRLIAGTLPPVVASSLEASDFERMRQRLLRLPAPPPRARLSRGDWRGAAGVFLLVFLSTFPVAVPFIFMKNVLAAMRVSNAIAVVLLFLTGVAYGRVVGRSPWVVGVTMVALGGVLVTLTIGLGG